MTEAKRRGFKMEELILIKGGKDNTVAVMKEDDYDDKVLVVLPGVVSLLSTMNSVFLISSR
mgnify:CR=1 FL=1